MKADYENYKEKYDETINNIIEKYTLGGLSECGKSGAGQYMNRNHNVWNMKLKYIIELLCQKYDIDNPSNVFNNDVLLVGLLEKEEIARFLKAHYYVEKISLESLHNYNFTQILKEIFQTQLKIIYIDTDYKKRIIRNAIGEGVSVEDSKGIDASSYEDVYKKFARKYRKLYI